MSSHTLAGFVKAAFMQEVIGGALGGIAGLALSRGGNLGQRMSAVAMGLGAGGALGSGIGGVVDDSDYSDLTPGELEVLREEAADADTWRNGLRLMALGGGLAGAIAYKSPLPLLTSLPAATIAPIGQETARMKRMAKDFRRARRSS